MAFLDLTTLAAAARARDPNAPHIIDASTLPTGNGYVNGGTASSAGVGNGYATSAPNNTAPQYVSTNLPTVTTGSAVGSGSGAPDYWAGAASDRRGDAAPVRTDGSDMPYDNRTIAGAGTGTLHDPLSRYNDASNYDIANFNSAMNNLASAQAGDTRNFTGNLYSSAGGINTTAGNAASRAFQQGNGYNTSSSIALGQAYNANDAINSDAANVKSGIFGLTQMSRANANGTAPVNDTLYSMSDLAQGRLATNGLGGLSGFAVNGVAGSQPQLDALNGAAYVGAGMPQSAALARLQAGGATQANTLQNFQAGGGAGQNALRNLGVGMGQIDANAAQQGLYNMATGPSAPSSAEALLRNQADTNMANSIALANSGRGAGQNAQALRAAMFSNAATQQQTGNQISALRAQEAQAAQNLRLSAFGAAGQQAQGITSQQAAAATAYEQAAQAASAQKLQALSQSGQLSQGMSAQQLQALLQSGQLAQGQNAQSISALQNAGQLSLGMSAQQLQALQAYQQGSVGAYSAKGNELNTIATTQLNQAAQQQAQYSAAANAGQGLVNSDLAKYSAAGSLAQGMGNLGVAQGNLGASLLGTEASNNSNLYNILGQRMNENGTLQANLQNQQINNEQNSNQFKSTMGYNIDRDREQLAAGMSLAASQQQQQRDASIIGAVGAALPLLAMASDERVKKNVSTLRDAFGGSDLRPAKGYAYEYKDPDLDGAVPGKTFGPMAQDLEKTKAGATTVFEGPDGVKRVHAGRLALVNTSAIADLQSRFLQLEKLVKREARA